jgi:hypothetical protein
MNRDARKLVNKFATPKRKTWQDGGNNYVMNGNKICALYPKLLERFNQGGFAG